MAKNGIRKLEHKLAGKLIEEGAANDKPEALALIRSGQSGHNVQHRRTGCQFKPKEPPIEIRDQLDLVSLKPLRKKRKRWRK